MNDKLIPTLRQKRLDWTHSTRKVPGSIRILNRYWITVDLRRDGPLPLVGDSTLRVDVKEHDARVIDPVLLNDVELVVGYRDRRHRPRREDHWDNPT